MSRTGSPDRCWADRRGGARPLTRTALRDPLDHKGRLVMTVVAIALGAAVAVASWTVSESAVRTVLGDGTRVHTGIVVRDATGEPTLTAADRERLAEVPGVEEATGVPVGRAGVVGDDGELVAAGFDQGGTAWDTTGRFELRSGRAPERAGEIALEAAAAEQAGLVAGDTARVLLAGGEYDAPTVVGVFDYRRVVDSASGREPVPALAYAPATARQLLGDRLDRVELTLTPGADPDTVQAAVAQRVGAGHRVASGAELAAEAERSARESAWDLRLALGPFVVVALLVGASVIANTFRMLVARRVRRFALLRAVGASRAQVRRSVLVEAAALGIAGGTLGAALGVALGPFVAMVMAPGQEFGISVSPAAVVAGYTVAVTVTVLAAHRSARRAAAVPPLAALRSEAGAPPAGRRRGPLLGCVALAVGGVAVAATADPSVATLPRLVSLGGATLGAIGVILLAPLLVEAVLRPMDRLVTRRGGTVARLAVRNAARDPRRTASTATALMIGLTLVCAFATLSATFADLIASTVRANIPATTTVLEPAGAATLAPEDIARARDLPEVGTVVASRDALAELRYPGGEARRVISAVDTTQMTDVLRPDVTEGELDLDGGALVSRNQADMFGLEVGDPLTLAVEGAAPVDTRVTGVYEASELQASVFVDAALFPEGTGEGVTTVYATGPDPAEARRALEAAFAGRPEVSVTDRDGLVEEGIQAQRLGFALMGAMFGIAVLIAGFGVVNTLALAVVERTREIGMLRAVGAGRRQVRWALLLESLIIAVFGGALGVVVGVAVGAVMQHSMLGQHLWDLTVPYPTLALALLGMVVVGVLAAVWPARRATRTGVLAALAAE